MTRYRFKNDWSYPLCLSLTRDSYDGVTEWARLEVPLGGSLEITTAAKVSVVTSGQNGANFTVDELDVS